MTEKEKMLCGELYDAGDPELMRERLSAEKVVAAYNAGAPSAALEGFLGAIGERSTLRAPFYCDYGYNIFLGDRVFLNFGCVLLDVGRIEIGDGTQIGPMVQIYAADHPRDPTVRAQELENGRPVVIGRNVWIGGGAIILPGVTVGDDAVIGAGSVVTRDVPAGATVMGNPARIKGMQ
ncbi:sugar O-acetyltransferase [Granulicella arctica]|uniref:sugar O-acetyltransferase n=1 Tax=Granulicella arctica TaxID=940613 RepID=UPI00295BF42F|nr:sugar O-acetyltransferase [Granulicella arctica]